MDSSSQLLPLQMFSGRERFDTEDEGWTLHQPGGDFGRIFTSRVTFERAFKSKPALHVGLVGFDIDNRDTARIRVNAQEITIAGFTAVIETWLGTRIWSVEVSWLALGHM